MEWTPLIILLTAAYFLVASITTFDVRLTQAKRNGTVPADEPTLPEWVAGVFWAQWGLFLWLLYLNWRYSVALFLIKFVLKVFPVLEVVGNILMTPFKFRKTRNTGDEYAALRRAFEPGEQRNQIDGATGEFGYERTNPIPADGNWYCRRLRCPAGHPYWYHRLGSVGPGPDHHTVDHIELQCFAGESRIKLFFDMYHVGPSSLVPRGLSMGSEAGRGSTRGLALPFPEALDEYDSPINRRAGTPGTQQAHVSDRQTAPGRVKSTTQSVPPGDRAPATRFFVRSHENGWAAEVIDMGGDGDDPRRFIAGIVKVGAEPLQTTPLTAYDVYADFDRARHESDQLLRKWTNHARCSASCLEWIEMEVRSA